MCVIRDDICAIPAPVHFENSIRMSLTCYTPPPTFVGTTCVFPSAPENVKGGEEQATHAAFISPHNFHLYPTLVHAGVNQRKPGGALNEVA